MATMTATPVALGRSTKNQPSRSISRRYLVANRTRSAIRTYRFNSSLIQSRKLSTSRLSVNSRPLM